MKKHVKYILCFAVAFVLSGCSTDIPLSQASRENIHTVSVDPKIPILSSAQYSGNQGERAISGMGLIGLAISSAMVAPTETKIDNAIKRRDIHMDKLLYQKFQAALRQQTHFKMMKNNDADAQFRLSINMYGFSDRVNSTKGTLLYVDVTGKLLSQGKVVWQATRLEYLSRAAYQYNRVQDYLSHRQLMIRAFNDLMTDAANSLVSTLNN